MPKPERLPGESIQQFAIRIAWERGAFWGDENIEGHNLRQSDLKSLKVSDDVVVKALLALSRIDPERYSETVLRKHNRLPVWDGELGPAMTEFLDLPRCPIPDAPPPPGVVFSFSDPDVQAVVQRMQDRQLSSAQGSGGWFSCHNIGNFHCSIVQWNRSGLPSFLEPVWKATLENVQSAYAGVGLLYRFVDENKVDLLTGETLPFNINIDASFVDNAPGWIGLAIVGGNENCSDRIWAKFLGTYKGGSTDAQITTQWSTLQAHEFGHNAGLSHSNGGVMSPSIQNGLPTGVWPDSDPSTKILRKLYGGVPVPIPGGGTPEPPKPPSETLEKRVENLELQSRIQSAMTKALAEMIGKMRTT